MKLKSKIHFYSSILFAVMLILMNVSIYLLFSRLSIDSQLKQTEAQGVSIAEKIRKSAGKVEEGQLIRAYVPVDGMVRIARQGSAAKPKKDMSTVTSPSEISLSQLAVNYSATKQVFVLEYEGRSYASTSIPVIWSTGEVVNIQLTESLNPTMEHLKVLRMVLAVVTAIALVPVVLSSRLLAQLIMRPISAMTATMKDIKRSGRFKRLAQEGQSKDELFEMGETFNDMIELLESNFEKQKRFISDASHELKTPLTVIESYAHLLLRRGKERPELFDESLHAIHSEAVRMKEMTEQLLMLAKHQEQWNVVIKNVVLNELAMESAKAITRAYGREVAVEAPLEQIIASTDENKLKQLLFIFLDNARKYSEQSITLIVTSSGNERMIAIKDRGIGIPKEDLPKVFDRFYRVDEARTRQGGGAGLGLSLAKEISDAIGARITLDSVQGIGTTITIILTDNREE
ncbi:HAMP domain-containing histidine kinase [Paenibacillus sp. GSMTC-2017]|uniref:sensor histidine kinase n=1 Tax=Paenibacillus sp. GSMTC-2017 TaxID=2794350 RepID=UPI0018D5D8D2|nr:HAMP domain-containing sensor histidine kinase [Paenibacillus sp. GSMTC-2017]MBH5320452.1 HAMP domain-containing histidine kinase [Paenibacillus sp. GSMTC-2017]